MLRSVFSAAAPLISKIGTNKIPPRKKSVLSAGQKLQDLAGSEALWHMMTKRDEQFESPKAFEARLQIPVKFLEPGRQRLSVLEPCQPVTSRMNPSC